MELAIKENKKKADLPVEKLIPEDLHDFNEQKELDKLLDENLKKGYIRPFQSPQVSPFFFVKKKDERL
jgi:hypothetical protein